MDTIKRLLIGITYLALLILVMTVFIFGLKWGYDTFPAVHYMIDTFGGILLTKF